MLKLYKPWMVLSLLTLVLVQAGCRLSGSGKQANNVRGLVDTVGFAHLDWQLDSVIARIARAYPGEVKPVETKTSAAWRVAICPHDDYTYAGRHYTSLLRNIKAKTIIIFGVAHKAKQLAIADKIVFDTYPYWYGPFQNIKVSSLREDLDASMPKDYYLVSDSLHKMEHSVESMLPFLQYYNRGVEIVSILVPYMKEDKMEEIAKPLASALAKVMKSKHLEWGKDLALLITTDAVHYGDEDWGGKNMAPYGTDSAGYREVVKHEHEIISNCLAGEPDLQKMKAFVGYTVKEDNYKEYKWTWCGRYSVPFGLMTAIDLQKELGAKPLNGKFNGYSTSIDHDSIPVHDLRMGKTAKASLRHWVGYASVGYE